MVAVFLLFSGCQPAPPPPDKLKILDTLRLRDWDGLETVLRKHQSGYEADADDEDVRTAFLSFANSDPDLAPLLDEWVAARGSYSAYLARGVYYNHLGWLSRGWKFAAQTDDYNFAEMRGYFTNSGADLAAALARNSRLPVAYELMVGMAMADGDDDARNAWVEEAHTHLKPSLHFYRRLMLSKSPKWGGDMRQLQALHKEVRKLYGEYPRLRKLEAFPALVVADIIDNDDRRKAIEYYDRAVKEGEGFWLYHFRRGRNYYYLDEYEKALADLNTALTQVPQEVDVLRWRALTLRQMKQPDRALADLNLAGRLDALQPDVVYHRGRIHYRAKQYDLAARDFEDSLVYRPRDPRRWWNYIKALF